MTEEAAAKHGGSEAGHDRGSLHMKISIQHLVGPPAADETNSIAVNAGTQERHGTVGASGPADTFSWVYVESGWRCKAARMRAATVEART